MYKFVYPSYTTHMQLHVLENLFLVTGVMKQWRISVADYYFSRNSEFESSQISRKADRLEDIRIFWRLSKISLSSKAVETIVHAMLIDSGLLI